MKRQNIDTLPAVPHHLLLGSQALENRKARVEQLRALVQAGLYRVDEDRLVGALLRDARAELFGETVAKPCATTAQARA